MRNYPINRGKSSCFPKPNITVLPPRSDKITRTIFGKAASVLTTCSQNTISFEHFSWFYTWYPMISIFSMILSISILVVFSTFSLRVTSSDDPWWPVMTRSTGHAATFWILAARSGWKVNLRICRPNQPELGLGTWELAEDVGFKQQNWDFMEDQWDSCWDFRVGSQPAKLREAKMWVK